MILPKYLTHEHIGDLKTIFNSKPFDLLTVDYNRMPLIVDEDGNYKLIKRHLKVEVVNGVLKTDVLVEPVEERKYQNFRYNPHDMISFLNFRSILGMTSPPKFEKDINTGAGDVKLVITQDAFEDFTLFGFDPRIVDIKEFEEKYQGDIKTFYKFFYDLKKTLEQNGCI